MEKFDFDYSKALEELEAIAAKVEDPATPLQQIDACIRRSEELTSRCREYLRSVRDRAYDLDNKENDSNEENI